MNLRNLEYFLTVVDSGTISQASRKLFISQQALSEQVRRLEKHFGTSLLERTNPVQLTPAGRLVYHAAQDIMARLELLDYRVAQLVSKPSDRLVISTGMSGTPPFLPEVMGLLQTQMPELQQVLIHPASLSGELTEPPPEADLLVGNMPFSKKCETVELLLDPLCVTLSEALLQRYFGSNLLQIKRELSDLTALEQWRRLPLWQDMHYPNGRDGKNLSSSVPQTTSLELIQHLCLSGQCAAVLPSHFAHKLFGDMPQMHIYPLADENTRFGVGVALRRGVLRNRATEEFIRIAKEYFSSQPIL